MSILQEKYGKMRDGIQMQRQCEAAGMKRQKKMTGSIGRHMESGNYTVSEKDD